MIRIDDRFVDVVATAVREIERATTAEIVVVASDRTSDYRDVALAAGAAAAWAALLVILVSPWPIGPRWIPLETAAIFLGVAWFARRSPAVVRRLTTRRRLAATCDAAARAAFLTHAVGHTRARTGLLVYVSRIEGRVVVIPDVGIQARIPDATWNALRWGADPKDLAACDTTEGFLAGLDAMGRALRSAFPAAGDNPNELADAPRLDR